MVCGIYRAIGERSRNEDSIAYEQVRTRKGNSALIVVADGIASMDFSDITSGYVVECMIRWFYSYAVKTGHIRKRKVIRSIGRAIYECKRELKQKAIQNHLSLGSTCTLIYIFRKKYMCVHIGDSVAFVGCKELKRITKLHRDDRGRLTRCIGSLNSQGVDITFGKIKKKMGILVATDGFVEKFDDAELSQVLLSNQFDTRESIERKLCAIGQETSKRGGTDNRSAIYCRI